jgi:hypothetical protein
MGTTLLLTVAIGAICLAGFFGFKLLGLRKRFEPIMSLDDEIGRLRQEIAAAKSRAATLNMTYQQAKQVHDRLLHETALLQEDLEDVSFGIYKPHYSFDTSEMLRAELEQIYDRKKGMVRGGLAAVCPTQWTVEGNKAKGAKMTRDQTKLMLRAFNGECDAATAKVTWSNAARMEERIRAAFEAINRLGEVNHIRVTQPYLDLCLAELRLTHEYEVKKQEEKEEQRAIREQMREEELARREFERAQREAASEREKAEKALAAARAELQKASGDHLVAIQAKITDLEQRVADAQVKQDRAVSMAQVTKMGHVYVISNLGSFGEGVFKIGMTRRLDPGDRIQELSGASVPFAFDTHAMIFSEDAPGLESAFHRQFAARRMNLVNMRKEYFRISLDEIATFAHTQGVEVEFTKLAEARQFRESEAVRLKAQQQGKPPEASLEAFPEALFLEEDEG